MRPKFRILTVALITVLLFAWSPWITANTASRLAQGQFNKAWYGVADGCGSYGTDSVTHDFQKIPFGATVTLDYQCGLVMPNEPARQTTVYISFLGVGSGYPKP